METFVQPQGGGKNGPEGFTPADWVVFYIFLVRSLDGEVEPSEEPKEVSAERSAKRQK